MQIHAMRFGALPMPVRFAAETPKKAPGTITKGPVEPKRTVTVSSSLVGYLPAEAQVKANQALDELSKLMKDFTEFFDTERVRRFNAAKGRFESTVKEHLPKIKHPRLHIEFSHPDMLKKRNLRSLDLSHTDMVSADGRPVDLGTTRLHKVNLFKTNLKNLSLKGAEFDEHTVLPGKLRRLGMKLAEKTDQGPWLCYTETWKEAVHPRFEKLKRWLARKG